MSRWLPGEHRAVSCSGKLRYETGAAAAAAKKGMKRGSFDRRKRAEVDVYRCQYCGCWHLGRPSQWKAKRQPEPPKIKKRDCAIR